MTKGIGISTLLKSFGVRLRQRIAVARRSTATAKAVTPYHQALTNFLQTAPDTAEQVTKETWLGFLQDRAKAQAFWGAAVDAERFLHDWQEALSTAMARACAGVSSADLLWAIRLLDPGTVAALELHEPIADDPVGAMACRRVAAHAALLYGSEGPSTVRTPCGDGLTTIEATRFAIAFAQLLPLAGAYALAHGLRAMSAAGLPIVVTPDGPRFLRHHHAERIALLYGSLDRRKGRSFSPFARMGEFAARAQPSDAPDGMSLFSARYVRGADGAWSYALVAWGLDPLREFFTEIDEDICRRALKMPGIAFVVLLAGLCHLIAEALALSDHSYRHAEGALVPLAREAVEGEALLRHAAGYLRATGQDPGSLDLAAARHHFLWLASSSGKRETVELPLRIQLGDTRHSYLLHRFDVDYTADLFHADHWLHRPLELLATGAHGKQADAKGKRFEWKLWDYLVGIDHLRPVNDLRGQRVPRSSAETQDDLDCAFALGSVLILIEAKSELLRFPAEVFYRAAIEDRWAASQRYLAKIDETAGILATGPTQPALKRGLNGITHILPLVCRPYPEWIPTWDARYWLRLPDQDSDDPGLPRILTPQELHDFLSTADEATLLTCALPHLIAIEA